MSNEFGFQCPTPNEGASENVLLSHGEGGRLSRHLIRQISRSLGPEVTSGQPDGALLPAFSKQPVFTTDSFVVTPLFFPGGDIGSLAVYGTVNDLAVSGAIPRWLSLSLIIEEGFPLSTLQQIIDSIRIALEKTNLQVVTGDTKVVPRGAADGLFINTAGIGEQFFPMPGATTLEVGDQLFVTGPIAQHGLSVLVAREQFEMEPAPKSDCGSLFPAVAALKNSGIPVRCMRDATRGGVTAVLHEWAESCGQTLVVDAEQIPLSPAGRGVTELLGLEPLHIACEGTMVVAVPQTAADETLRVLSHVPISQAATRIGEVIQNRVSPVVIRRALGQFVSLDEPTGAQLPRIC